MGEWIESENDKERRNGNEKSEGKESKMTRAEKRTDAKEKGERGGAEWRIRRYYWFRDIVYLVNV